MVGGKKHRLAATLLDSSKGCVFVPSSEGLASWLVGCGTTKLTLPKQVDKAMEAVGLLIAFVGIAVTIGIAWWQHRRALRAEALLKDMPQQVVNGVKKVLAEAPEQAQPESVRLSNWPRVVSFADVDGDGEKELLVQYPVAAHGSALRIFGWRGQELEEIGDLGVGTGAGFEVGDFDSDGQLEIMTEETDWSVGLPYYAAPRFKIFFRWNGREFAEAWRSKDYTEEEAERMRKEFYAKETDR